MIRRVKTGKVSDQDRSVLFAEPCTCGIGKLRGSAELLGKQASLHIIDRERAGKDSDEAGIHWFRWRGLWLG